ncbi:MAG: hypothetical protein H7833_00505 [Magnetococcus sp. DMHC-1]
MLPGNPGREGVNQLVVQSQWNFGKELATKADLRELEYRMTIRLGGIMIAGFSALGILMKLN